MEKMKKRLMMFGGLISRGMSVRMARMKREMEHGMG